MPSKLPKGVAEYFVLARQALWAGDRVGALEYLELSDDALSANASRRVNQYESLQDIVAADVQRIRTDLQRLEARAGEDGDLAGGGAEEDPYVATASLRGAVYGDGFGHFRMKAYLTELGLEDEFRAAVDRAAAAGIKVALDDEKGNEDVPGAGEGEEDEGSPEMIDASRAWIDANEFPKVHVHVGEFPLIDARCSWCPVPETAEEVRERFTAVLRSIDPMETA